MICKELNNSLMSHVIFQPLKLLSFSLDISVEAARSSQHNLIAEGICNSHHHYINELFWDCIIEIQIPPVLYIMSIIVQNRKL